MLSWGWQWALSWDLPIYLALASSLACSFTCYFDPGDGTGQSSFCAGICKTHLFAVLLRWKLKQVCWSHCTHCIFVSFVVQFLCIMLFYDTLYFRLGVTFLSSGYMKWLMKEPQWLLQNNGGRTGLTAGLVVGSGVYLSMIFWFSSSIGSWEQVMHRAHWIRRKLSKTSKMNSPKGLFWGLEGRSLGEQAIFSPFFL